ncbi:MAG: class I SAM-dependent methyltransferase, partial [Bacteroidota bacterium]
AVPSLDWNFRIWAKRYQWEKDGDEWDDQAQYCKQPYELWKKVLTDEFMKPYIGETSEVLEIGPGHGRWLEYYVDKAQKIDLVDLSPACIDYCQQKFANYSHIKYFSNNGQSLSFISDQSIDFIWSYDVFVHIEIEQIHKYLLSVA